MSMFRVAFAVALLAPYTAVAETAVTMPSVGFRYTTQMDVNSTQTTGPSSKVHSVLKREVISSDGTVIQTRNEGTGGSPGSEITVTGKTIYRLFFLTNLESTAQMPGQPPFTNSTTWDCPADGLDRFYPRGAAAQVSLECKLTETLRGQVMGPKSFTLSFSDLGKAQDTTLAGTFEVRKIAVRYSAVDGFTSEITYDFAPALGISVVQETKVSTPHGETVSHIELADFTPAP